MKALWLLSACSITVFLASCGEVKKPAVPHYRFETGIPLVYKISGNLDATIDAGILKTTSSMQFNFIAEITPAGTNQYGTILKVDIKDPEITGAVPQAATAFYSLLNSFRNAAAETALTETGTMTVLTGETPVNSTLFELIFPDFKDFNALSGGVDSGGKIPLTYQDQKFVFTVARTAKIYSADADMVIITNSVTVKGFDPYELEKSVDAQPLGNINMETRDVFSLKSGQLSGKNGAFKFNIEYPMKSGFLTFVITLTGTGNLQAVLQGPVS